MNIDLPEMSHGRLDDLDVRKPHRNIIREGDPELAVTLGGLQGFVVGRLVENGLRCVANQESGSRELYRQQHSEIFGPGRCDHVHRARGQTLHSHRLSLTQSRSQSSGTSTTSVRSGKASFVNQRRNRLT